MCKPLKQLLREQWLITHYSAYDKTISLLRYLNQFKSYYPRRVHFPCGGYDILIEIIFQWANIQD